VNELRFAKPQQRQWPGYVTFQLDAEKVAINPRFEKYLLKVPAVERLTTGLRWAKALVWFGYGRYLPAALFRPTPGPNMKARSCEGVSNCP
jgi:gluconolactonase